MVKYIELTGIKTHNLKNLRLKIPKGQLTALVGVSGAGKTSLAFDTIYAEGYLRYIESISPYIRQFLDKIEKPRVDQIEGLPPAISFRHKKPAKNPRSIVATSLDIYDYLRLLYAKISDFYCPSCDQKIKKYTIDEIILEILEEYRGKIDICFLYKGDIAFLINRGYYFYIEDGIKKRVSANIKNQSTYILLDSVEIKTENKSRMFEAFDQSISLGSGYPLAFINGKKKEFPIDFYCPGCGIKYEAPKETTFSFNNPKGACPDCKGFGDIQTLDQNLILDGELSLANGALKPFNSHSTHYYGHSIILKAKEKGIDIHCPVKKLNPKEIKFIMEGDFFFRGVHGYFERLKSKRYKVQARVFISRYSSYQPCPTCNGTRLNQYARSFRIKDKNITDFLSLSIEEAYDFIHSFNPETYQEKLTPEVFIDIKSRLYFLVETGLSYIHLNRPTFTLSRGEYQRINLAYILGSTLSDSLLVLDQPSSDLHPQDYAKLEKFLRRLRNNNTVIMIEHNPDIVKICDHVIELGPLSGDKGGKVVFNGLASEFFLENPEVAEKSNITLTQHHFNQIPSIKKNVKNDKGWIEYPKANTHNLKNIEAKVPLNSFTVIAGVSGAGKTTLLYNEMYLKFKNLDGGKAQIKDIVFIDPGMSRIRSQTNVAGFFEVFKAIRELFAGLKESQLLNYTPAHFNFNSPLGRCEECMGKGFTEIEMQFLPPVNAFCSYCNGTGYKLDILKVCHKDLNIFQVLELSIDQFLKFACDDIPRTQALILQHITDSGLGYIKLGQRIKTMSSGELQRMKLVKNLNLKKTKTIFLIDEPSFGMHPYDIEKVKQLIRKIIANNNTVIVAEHHLSLISSCDYMIELGPGGGEEGGYLLFQGNLSDIFKCNKSIIKTYLKKNKKNT